MCRTCKCLLQYLILIPDPWKRNNLFNCRYIFSTEGHLFPATPQISLVREHCSYLGAYCSDSNSRVQTRFSDFAHDPGETNGSYSIPAASVSRASSNFHTSTVSGLIKVLSWSPSSAFLWVITISTCGFLLVKYVRDEISKEKNHDDETFTLLI